MNNAMNKGKVLDWCNKVIGHQPLTLETATRQYILKKLIELIEHGFFDIQEPAKEAE